MSKREQIIQHYLLGELPESEQVKLEQEYFSDPQMFEQVVQVENELVDQYARGLLPPATRARFEEYYLGHLQRRERAQFAEALRAKVEQSQEGSVAGSKQTWFERLSAGLREPRLAWTLSIAVLFFAVLAGWYFMETRRLRHELAQHESERAAHQQRERELQQQMNDEQQRAAKLAEELASVQSPQDTARSSPSPQTSTFATLLLSIGGTRSADGSVPAVLRIPAGTEQVRLQLNLRENNYSRYQVEIQSAGGNSVFNSRQLASPRKKIDANLSLVIPSETFPTGDYILTLRGATPSGDFEDVNKSLFQVVKK